MASNFVWPGFVAALAQTALGDWQAFPRQLSALFDAARTGFEVALGLSGSMRRRSCAAP